MTHNAAAEGVTISEESITTLPAYGTVSIAFDVRGVLDVISIDSGLGGLLLRERRVHSWRKDYDSSPGDSPADWPKRFDVSGWGFLAAHLKGARVGGAAIAFGSADALFDNRRDVAVLWDIRVAPSVRSSGIGGALFGAVERWALARGCRRLKAETQNTNTNACKFYARQGCYLGAIHRFAYADLPDEVQLLWYKDLIAVA